MMKLTMNRLRNVAISSLTTGAIMAVGLVPADASDMGNRNRLPPASVFPIMPLSPTERVSTT